MLKRCVFKIITSPLFFIIGIISGVVVLVSHEQSGWRHYPPLLVHSLGIALIVVYSGALLFYIWKRSRGEWKDFLAKIEQTVDFD